MNKAIKKVLLTVATIVSFVAGIVGILVLFRGQVHPDVAYIVGLAVGGAVQILGSWRIERQVEGR